MSNKEICKVFATSVKQGKANSMFIEGNTIYSYGHHFPMARKTTYKTVDGRKIAFVTTRTYSNTTARHMHHARFALSIEDWFLIEIEDVSNENIDTYKSQLQTRLDEAISKKSKARKEWSKEIWEREESEIKTQLFELSNIALTKHEQRLQRIEEFADMQGLPY